MCVCVCVLCVVLLVVLCGCETPSHTLDLRKWITKQNGKEIFYRGHPIVEFDIQWNVHRDVFL